MKFVFTRRYLQRLKEISGYIEQENPLAAGRVILEIERTVIALADYPFSGQATTYRATRRVVVSKYGYIVYYRVLQRQRVIELLTVTHGRQERPFEVA